MINETEVVMLWMTTANQYHTRCDVLKFFDSRPIDPMQRTSFSRIKSFFSFQVCHKQCLNQTKSTHITSLILINPVQLMPWRCRQSRCVLAAKLFTDILYLLLSLTSQLAAGNNSPIPLQHSLHCRSNVSWVK